MPKMHLRQPGFTYSASGSSIKNENISNKELAKQLNKPIVTNFNKKSKTHFLLTIFGSQI